MNRKQTNKLAAFTATESVLRAAPEIASVPGLPDMVTELSAKVDELNRLAKTQTQPTQPRTSERDQLFASMTEMLQRIAGYVRSVARESGRPQLALEVRMGLGTFLKTRWSHRVWFAQRVLDAARTVLPELGAYGVTGEMLDTFAALIQDATQCVNLPRETVGAKSAATQQLAVLFADVEALLDDGIAVLLFPVRKNHVEFYARYQAARQIIDRRGTRRESSDAEEQPASPVIVAVEGSTRAVEQQRAA